MLISACGLICDECQFFNKPCKGCYKVGGKTFWAQEAIPAKICPLFNCAVHELKLSNCGECHQLPCKKFMELKDPHITEEEHKASIQKRVDRLRSN